MTSTAFYSPRSIVRAIVVAALALLVSGCSRPIELTVRGNSDMNMGGNAAVVRIYQLRNNSRFERASIESLWRNDEALENDLAARREEVMLYPDQEQTVELSLEKDTRFIGIAANLREAHLDAWKEVHPVNRVRGRQLTVVVGTDRIELVGR